VDAAGYARNQHGPSKNVNTVIALSPRERAELFSGAAQTLGFGNEVIIEKDFWVCWTLQQLFNEIQGFGPHLVFKGGTSLSKVYGAIKRFSEDVDITLGRELLGMDSDEHDPEKASSGNQKKKRIEAIRSACSQWVAGDLASELRAKTNAALGEGVWSYVVDEADDSRQTLLFKYPSVLPAPAATAYIPRFVRIECGAKADVWPVTETTIKPYVAEAYTIQIIGASVAVRTLAVERTFWEKATILHAEANRPPGKAIKANFSRHYADTASLADHAGGKNALLDPGLRRRVVAFKEAFYANTWSNYDTAIPGAFKLLPADAHLETLKNDYRRMQGEMYFGPSADWDEVIARLRALQAEIDRLPA
jgi:hypothetical protein